jgi:hypothetical protein
LNGDREETRNLETNIREEIVGRQKKFVEWQPTKVKTFIDDEGAEGEKSMCHFDFIFVCTGMP